MKATTLASTVLAAGALWLGCNQIIGLDPPQLEATGGSSTHGSAASTGSASSTTATGTGAGGSTGGSGGGGGGTGGSLPMPVLPTLAAAANLQLWLTADFGLVCNDSGTPSRVLQWTDLSGNGRQATPTTALGPRCGQHKINKIVVPYFSAPGTTAPFTDETLNVDLTFLVGTAYTVFVVERRWADRPAGSGTTSSTFFGTTIPDETGPTCQSATPPDHTALQFGYVYYNGPPQIGINVICFGCKQTSALVPTPGPAPAAFDMERFDPAVGQQVWVNGAQVANLADLTPLKVASGGAIGRAPNIDVEDDRFLGDIAEVVVFDAALTEPDRMAMEGYLKMHWAL